MREFSSRRWGEEYLRSFKQHFWFRLDPVPFTSCFRPNGRYYRKPRTRQELRLNCDPMHAEYTRGKRRRKQLPNDWDDIWFGRQGRSWKNCTNRKHQYKEKRQMKVEDIEDIIEDIKHVAGEGPFADLESSHIMEDDLYTNILTEIANGAENAQELARAAVDLIDLDLDKWYA